ncbi:hypothetical protein Pelo_6646 [Pelomyxa schiedti]|nr:hypothetical protein Pelo_6646 [Pelomyxa schiedti]
MSTTTTSTASTGLDAMIMGNVLLMLTRPARLDNNTTRGAAPIPACLKPNLHAVFVVARVCSEWNRACSSNALWQIMYQRDFGHFPLPGAEEPPSDSNWKQIYKDRLFGTFVVHLTTGIPADSPTISREFFQHWMFSKNRCPVHLEVFSGLPPAFGVRPPRQLPGIQMGKKKPAVCVSFISQFLLIAGCPYTEEDFVEMGQKMAEKIFLPAFDEDDPDESEENKTVRHVSAHIEDHTLLTLSIEVLAKDPIATLMNRARSKLVSFSSYALSESVGVLLHPMFKTLRKYNRHLKKAISGKGKATTACWDGQLSQRSLSRQIKGEYLNAFGCKTDWSSSEVLEDPSCLKLAKCTRGCTQWSVVSPNGSTINWVFSPPHQLLLWSIVLGEEDTLEDKYGVSGSDLDQLEEAFSREQQATGRTGDHDTTVEVLQREFEIDINKYGDSGASITETDNS